MNAASQSLKGTACNAASPSPRGHILSSVVLTTSTSTSTFTFTSTSSVLVSTLFVLVQATGHQLQVLCWFVPLSRAAAYCVLLVVLVHWWTNHLEVGEVVKVQRGERLLLIGA